MHALIHSKPKNKTWFKQAKYTFGQVATQVLGAVPYQLQAALPRHYDFDAHTFSKKFASTHYGVMIPDLPEPLRYLSFAAVIGDVGAKITRTSPKLTQYVPVDTATLVHSTALTEQNDGLHIYSVDQDLSFQQSPFRANFSDDAALYEEDGVYRLESHFDNLQVDLTLTPTEAITWFAYGTWYQHFSLLMHYQGVITQDNEKYVVQGLCTLEHWKAISTSLFYKKVLPEKLALPLDTFSYQVINLNASEQLVLAYVGIAGEPAYTAVSYRHTDGTSIQYEHAQFEVLALKTDTLLTPDGYVMEVPQSFRWLVTHQGKQVLDLLAVVDTPYCYGLAAGYVGSYQWSGEFEQEKMMGRGYLEYIDRR